MRNVCATGRFSGDGYLVSPHEGPPFIVPKYILLEHPELSVEDDQEIESSLFELLLHLNRCALCRQKGLDLLVMREHSSLELKQKLYKRKFTSDEINDALSYLKRKDYLSDERFAEIFIRSRLRRKSEGKSVMMQRLMQKGVNRRTAEIAWDEEAPDESLLLDRAFEATERKFGTKDEKRIAYLVRSGFRYGQIVQKIKNREP